MGAESDSQAPPTQPITLTVTRPRQLSRRSRTGCRTCRTRRIKCDERPVACANCTQTGRKCDGYDVHRIPRGGRQEPVAVATQLASSIDTAHPAKLQWPVTSDEGRCLSFFQHRSVPQLVTYCDSALWQRLVLQLCYLDRAVFHAVVALAAVNQAHEITQQAMRTRGGVRHALLPKKKQQRRNKWYLFALEQSGRSFAILNKRCMSQDPMFPTIILVCCILFTMCEILHRNVDNAISHVQSGIRILKGMQVQRQPSGLGLTCPSMIEECVVETFLGLQGSSVFYGTRDTLHIDMKLVFEQPYGKNLDSFTSLKHARTVLRPLLHTLFPFIAQCMGASDAQIQATYATLQRQQGLLLSYFTRFLHSFETFCMETYGTSTFTSITPITTPKSQPKDLRLAEITRLSALYSIHASKIALFPKTHPLPPSLAHDCSALIAAAENTIHNFMLAAGDGEPSSSNSSSPSPPTLTTSHQIVPALYIAIVRCPHYGPRCRGIRALRAWASEEDFMSASLNADILEEAMKVELRAWVALRGAGGREMAVPPGVVGFEMDHNGRDAVAARLVYTVGGGDLGTDGVGGEVEEHCVLLDLGRNEALVDELLAVGNARSWPCVRALGLLNHVEQEEE
ncbi:C6 zinc finger domain protein [Aspergillus ustus]|uniref:C6 zinc finger domain protein n=1 Tax=Aspergillus ustus TaxID=40382 RepID=A0A0C1BUZ1_ASPUT|nr:C6 zinc finger domain protein [Aspergillus ustus]